MSVSIHVPEGVDAFQDAMASRAAKLTDTSGLVASDTK
jgi:hypothetical protein